MLYLMFFYLNDLTFIQTFVKTIHYIEVLISPFLIHDINNFN